MSDLNKQIQSWRQSLSSGSALQQDDLDELEEHLRESIAELTVTGLSEEESILVAARRLGSADMLRAEFSKVNRFSQWCNRLQWLWAGYIIGTIFVTFFSAYFRASTPTGSVRLGIAMVVNGLILGLFYLIPYAKLLRRPRRSIQRGNESSNSFTAILASIVSFLVIGIPVFFGMSITVAELLAPNLSIANYWVGKAPGETYGIGILVILSVSLPPAVVFGIYSAKQTLHYCGRSEDTERLSEA